MVNKNIMINNIKKHKIDKNICSPLADNLRHEYHKKNARVIKGIQREASKGGKVKVQIHSSNVMITSLNLQDKQRENVIRKIKSSPDEKKEVKTKPTSTKTKIRRNLKIKNVRHTKLTQIAGSKRSQDNKGDK